MSNSRIAIEAAECTAATAVAASRPATSAVRVLKYVFAVQFLQLAVLILISFIYQGGPVFILRMQFFGIDYHAYYTAARLWLSGGSPYDWAPFFTPPFSAVAGLVFYPLGFELARVAFFFLNVGLILLAVFRFGREIDLSREGQVLFAFVTLAYYPFYTVVERGNMDGLMLACLLFAYSARHRIARAFLIALSIGIKFYSVVLVGVLGRKKQWRLLALVAALAVAIELPWHGYLGGFLDGIIRRSGSMRLPGNISPAVLFWFTGFHWWREAFFCFWVLTLGFVLWRDKARDDEHAALLRYIPWMIAMPTLVFAHSGVLLLATFGLLLKKANEQVLNSEDWLCFAGFLLTSVQAVGFGMFSGNLSVFNLLWMAAPVGMMLIIVSCCLAAMRKTSASQSF